MPNQKRQPATKRRNVESFEVTATGLLKRWGEVMAKVRYGGAVVYVRSGRNGQRFAKISPASDESIAA